MDANIVDTTLRDGEQRAGIALKLAEKVHIARLLDSIGIYQIEAGIPAMGGEEKKSVQRIAGLGLKCRISSWNRLSMSDIEKSMECGTEIIHISVPSSDIQIESKLGKTREWVVDNLRRCTSRCVEKGFTVTMGLEDASRADMPFLLKLAASAFAEGVQVVRYADTVGIQVRQAVFECISAIRSALPVEVEMHAHNDLGMAVANSVAAVRAGAALVDCTVGGIGERAGNCDLLQFIKSARACLGLCGCFDLKKVREVQAEILGIIK
jgi:homocitrate synthase NifV